MYSRGAPAARAVDWHNIQGYPSRTNPVGAGLVDRWPRTFSPKGPKCGGSAGANKSGSGSARNVNFNNGNVNNNNNKDNNNNVRCRGS